MVGVYVKTTGGVITAINSGTFLTDFDGWVKIDEGEGDLYVHAQGNYLPKSLINEQGGYRYKLADRKAVERTESELAGDATPALAPSDSRRLAAVEAALLELALGGELYG